MDRNRAAFGGALVVCLAAAGWFFVRGTGPSGEDAVDEPVQDGAREGRGADAESSPLPAPPTYVGSARCAECHEEAAAAFAGSDHDRAIEAPSDASVEAPFDGRTFTDHGVETRFRIEEEGGTERYLVRTEGPAGEPVEYPVGWTFGVRPLQQYLLDVGDGRLQCLTVAWDSRPEAEGGQRFFSLYPDEEIPPEDPLHWTGPMQNWNSVCADCHTTAYEKGYDAETDSFTPAWAELDVGCEACHGPGSNHVAWADARETARAPETDGDARAMGLVIDLSNARDWVIAASTHNATPQPDGAHDELDTCAPCHSRRHQIAEPRRPDQPLFDFYRPELLTRALYHPDGQIDGEVYVYGSFTQSRMFHAGVRCSDCHDPHTLAPRADGDALCAQCHDAEVYAASSHHHHAPETEGSACVSCHMPSQVYMGVDARRDHSLRVPRPDLSVTLGTPNACTECHRAQGNQGNQGEQDPAWAAARAREWWPGDRPPHFGTVLRDGRRGDPDALEGLIALARDIAQPAIVRGTALLLLERYQDRGREALAEGARDADPLIRLGAVLGARGLSPRPRLSALAEMLGDPFRVLRIEAAQALSIVPPGALRDDVGEALRSAQGELIEADLLHADRSDAWLRIAVLETDRGRIDEAETALRHAIELEPRGAAARVNLADLARMRGDEAAAERWLREAIEFDPDHAEALHGLGLLAIRTGRPEEALTHLSRAAELRPSNPRFAYVAAVALWDQGSRPEALATLAAAIERHPFDPDLLEARRAYQDEQ
ncbi:MAG: tetratricopeptide repeat protein [Deltaproteobacteria bacterium]|nr:tetratricopeptide repeat protein [Deltaproteobacteria bacterium]